tara:strand:- start:2371 stop:3063 length:693 start_codon:yes stop_codon:yes gene_type:complete
MKRNPKPFRKMQADNKVASEFTQRNIDQVTRNLAQRNTQQNVISKPPVVTSQVPNLPGINPNPVIGKNPWGETIFDETIHKMYIFISRITIGGNDISNKDWVGAFIDGQLVGAIQNIYSNRCMGNMCPIVVNGLPDNSNVQTSWSMNTTSIGKNISFKVFDTTNNQGSISMSSNPTVQFQTNGLVNIDSLKNTGISPIAPQNEVYSVNEDDRKKFLRENRQMRDTERFRR